jgi:hypothetical protein
MTCLLPENRVQSRPTLWAPASNDLIKLPHLGGPQASACRNILLSPFLLSVSRPDPQRCTSKANYRIRIMWHTPSDAHPV